MKLAALMALASLLTFSALAARPQAVPGGVRFKEGDAAFRERKDPVRARKALEVFRELHVKTPNDPQAGWRRSMACYYVGLHLATEDKEKAALFAEGRMVGLAAAKTDPKCAPCHFWGAINMALYGQTMGVFKMVFMLSDVQKHLEETTRLDPTYGGAGGLRLLGLIQQKLPGILGGSDELAKTYFEKAIATAPEEPMNYHFLAILLAENFGNVAAAREVAKKGLQVPRPASDRIESLSSLAALQDFLKKLAEKG